MKIIQYPNPILLEKIEPIIDFDDPALKDAVSQCTKFLRHETGAVGVAANQLDFRFRFFVFLYGNVSIESVVIYNPVIVHESNLFEASDEGCLSFIDETTNLPVYKEIYRPDWIEVLFQASNGEFVFRKLSGDTKNIFCHEIDHLNGKTYLDRTSVSSHV